MIVAFHLHRRPLSLNAKLSRGYMEQIAELARRRYSGPPLSQTLYSRIIWFHKSKEPRGDVDNIPKRIHDALKGILFLDDHLITHTMTVRVDASDGIDLVANPADPLTAAAVLDSVNDPAVADILYIEVGAQTDSRIYMGPIA